MSIIEYVFDLSVDAEAIEVIRVGYAPYPYNSDYYCGESDYPSSPLIEEFYLGLPVEISLSPDTPNHFEPYVSSPSQHLAHIPLVCPSVPKPDTKPKGPRPQPPKPTSKVVPESVQAPKSDPISPFDSITPPQCVRKRIGIYGPEPRMPGSYPRFIYAFPREDPKPIQLTRCKPKSAKRTKPKKASESCLFNDPVFVSAPRSSGVKKIQTGNVSAIWATIWNGSLPERAAKKVRGIEVTLPVGGMFVEDIDWDNTSSFLANNASTSSLDGGEDSLDDKCGSSKGSDSKWCHGEEPTNLDEDKTSTPSSSTSTSSNSLLTPTRSSSLTQDIDSEFDIELINIDDVEPDIQYLQIPAPPCLLSRTRYQLNRSRLSKSYLSNHLHRALGNFWTGYSGSLSSLSSTSMESNGPRTPLLGHDESYVHVPRREEEWCDGEELNLGMGVGAIPMRSLRRSL